MLDIFFSDRIKTAAPNLKVIQIEATVSNHPTGDALWDEIEKEAAELKDRYKLSEINKRVGINATRWAYKTLGKDPNRYRPSAEALCRRIINGKGIYRLTTLIDAINLISIATGYSIGGFDKDNITGRSLTLDVGMHDEPFNAIGRGPLNIEGMPVYRDEIGGIGTPTSDEERTKLTPSTSNLLMIVNIYGEDMTAENTLEYIKDILSRHASLSSFHFKIINAVES